MKILTTPSGAINLVTDSAAAIHVNASWVDRNGTTSDTHGHTSTTLAGVATNTIVGTPTGGSIYRNVREMTIANTATGTSCGVKVTHFDGTTTSQIYAALLSPGWEAAYGEDGWKLHDAAGQQRTFQATGVYQGSTVFDRVGTFLFTPGPNTNMLYLRGGGGGGAGGGCNSVATAASAAGGGSAGGYVEKRVFVTPLARCVLSVGGGGTGVSAAAGGTGMNSGFYVPTCTSNPSGAILILALGGLGATAGAAVNTMMAAPGAGHTMGGTNGDINVVGMPGRNGMITIRATTSTGASGKGGDSPFGRGGAPVTVAGNGNAGVGNGSGGSGAFTNASTARTGGNGAPGFWNVDEYS